MPFNQMNFSEIPFTDPNAARIYRDYMRRVSRCTKSLNKHSQQEVVMEINSHIYEALRCDGLKTTEETSRLLDIVEKLGQPELFLKPLVAGKAMDEATKTFNPIKMIRALALNLSNGFTYILFFLSYLLLFCFALLIVLKLFWPDDVGIYYNHADFLAMGIVNREYQQYEIAGDYFVPITLALAAITHFIITLLVKMKRAISKRKKPQDLFPIS